MNPELSRMAALAAQSPEFQSMPLLEQGAMRDAVSAATSLEDLPPAIQTFIRRNQGPFDMADIVAASRAKLQSDLQITQS